MDTFNMCLSLSKAVFAHAVYNSHRGKWHKVSQEWIRSGQFIYFN